MSRIKELLGNKIVSNASWLIGCKVAKAVLALVVTMLTARYLGPSNFGLINYAASIVLFVVPIAQLGLRNVQVNEIINREDQEGAIIGTSVFLSFLSSIICIFGIGAFVYFVNAGETETLVVCLLYSSLLIFQTGEIIQYWFQAKYIAKYSAIVSFSAYFLVSVYKIYILAAQKNIYWFAVTYMLDYLLISVLLLILYHRHHGKKLTVSWRLGKELLAQSKYFIIPELMVSVFSQTDRIMLKTMAGNDYTGFYSAAFTCASIGNFVFLALIDAMRPSIYEGKKNNEKNYYRHLTQLYSIVIYFSLFMCLTESIFSKWIILIAYGENYAPAASALRIVVWHATFSYIGTINAIWFLAEKKQDRLWIINGTGMILNVIINFVLIPIWGVNGAAIASLATQFFSNFVMIAMIPESRPLFHIILQSCNIKKLLDGLRR